MKINIEFKDGKTKEEVNVKIITEAHPYVNNLVESLTQLIKSYAIVKLQEEKK